jgi:hypothetical protein
VLFSQEIPTGNLGFVDSRATTVDVTICGEEYSIHQSPTLLSSSRAGGTTGAGMFMICASPNLHFVPPPPMHGHPAVCLIFRVPGEKGQPRPEPLSFDSRILLSVGPLVHTWLFYTPLIHNHVNKSTVVS